MSLFSDNIKYLRMRRDVTQQSAADALDISRTRYAKYEDGANFPPPETLVALSRYFHTSIDLLLTVDIRKFPLEDLLKLDDNRILLPITVDRNRNNYIEIVTHKARAGYAAGGFADARFIAEELEHVYLPWLDKNQKYRTFPVDGDSMPPHNNKSYIVGRYIERLGDVLDGRTYIIITKNQEMVYKRLNRNGKNTFVLQSDNSFYKPYEIKYSDILEIWEYAGSIERENFNPQKQDPKSLETLIRELQKDMEEIKRKVIG